MIELNCNKTALAKISAKTDDAVLVLGSGRQQHDNYNSILAEIKDYRRLVRDTLRRNSQGSKLKTELDSEYDRVRSQKLQLRSFLDEALRQVDDYKDVKAELSLNCADLERENLELREENVALKENNRALRDVVNDYMLETDRYERALSKIYERSTKADEELLHRAKLALSL